MKIHVPKNLGEELPLLPDGPCTAVVKEITSKKNLKSGNVQMYVKWIVTSEMYTDGEKTSIGEPVLDNYTLIDAALWRLNNLYLGLTGQSLNDLFAELTGNEEGDIETEELIKAISDKIKGMEANLLLESETYEGKTRTKVKTVQKEAFVVEGEPTNSSILDDDIPF